MAKLVNKEEWIHANTAKRITNEKLWGNLEATLEDEINRIMVLIRNALESYKSFIVVKVNKRTVGQIIAMLRDYDYETQFIDFPQFGDKEIVEVDLEVRWL